MFFDVLKSVMNYDGDYYFQTFYKFTCFTSMPIFTILLVVAVFVLICWLVQRYLQDPARVIVLVVLVVILLVYLFRVFGLADVRV